MELSRRATLSAAAVGLMAASGCSALPSVKARKEREANPKITETLSGPSTSTEPTDKASVEPAPAGTVWTKQSPADLGLSADGMRAGAIAGPHLALLLKTVTSERLPGQWHYTVNGGSVLDDLPAAAGETWLMISAQAWAPLMPSTKYYAKAHIKIGEKIVDLMPLLGTFDQYTGYRSPWLYLAISMPKNTQPTVHLTSAGKTAVFDLVSAKLAPDADSQLMLKAITKDETTVSATEANWSGGWADGRNVAKLGLQMTFDPKQCYLMPWTPSTGWAKPGRLWFALWYRVTDYEANFRTPLDVDVAKTARLTIGKQSIAPRPRVIEWLTERVNTAGNAIVFDVPEKFTGGSFKLTMPSRVTISYSNGEKRTQTLRSSGPFATTITVAR